MGRPCGKPLPCRVDRRGMEDSVSKPWDSTAVRIWLESRVASARADQVVAEKGGRKRQDDCDLAAAEEMVCTLLRGKEAERAFVGELKALLDRDEYVWRGVYDDRRFDRHMRTYVRKLLKMAKASEGFGNLKRYQ